MNSVVVTDRRFLNEYRNGSTFATSPTIDYVPYLQANIFENVKLFASYDVSTTFELIARDTFVTVETYGSNIRLFHPYATWDDTEGVSVGDTLLITCNSSTTTQTVVSIAGNQMFITSTDFYADLGISSGDERTDFSFVVTNAPNGLIFKFGLVPNSQTSNTYNSLLDSQQQVYSVNSKTSSPTYTELNYLSSESSNLGSVEYTYDGVAADGYTHQFTIAHTFRIPYFIDSWLANVLDSTIPDLFSGTESLRYVSNLNFCNNILDPNNGKKFTDSFQLGSVGFIGQNFNAGVGVYSLTDSTLQIDSVDVDEVDVAATNVFTASIQRGTGNFSSGEKVILYHARLANSSEYSDNSDSLDENFTFDSLAVDEGASAANGTIIKNFTATINGGDASIIDLEFELEYPAGDQIDFTAGDNIVLCASIGEIALDPELDNRQLIEIYAGAVAKDQEDTSIITNFDLSIWETGAPGTTFQAVDSWVNRAFECSFNFDIQKDADSDFGRLNSLTYKLVCFNPTTLDFGVLDTYVFPLGTIPTYTVDGTSYQAKDIDTERFLSVPSGDSLREVQLNMEVVSGSYQATQEITGKFGFIVPWQEWIENGSIPTEFYDAALADEFFNLNFRSSNYSDVNGYFITVLLIANVSYQQTSGAKVGPVSTYDIALRSNTGEIADFDVDPNAVTWTQTTKVYNEDGDELDNILTTELNLIEIEMSSPIASGLSPQGIIGEIIFEPTGNTGRHFRLSSYIDYSEAINPLEPLTGETGVKVTVGASSVTLECNLNGALLDTLTNYNIYGHLRPR